MRGRRIRENIFNLGQILSNSVGTQASKSLNRTPMDAARYLHSSSKRMIGGSYAKPIPLVLELKGEDVRQFLDYMENPTITPEGAELLKKAAEIAKKRGLF